MSTSIRVEDRLDREDNFRSWDIYMGMEEVIKNNG
jgi:hypothetical protein